mmetsp:Transcript_31561/g.92535  ORF Transcript_31561/g.92535 Transcript_31561/m.92535 type:complete len:208 (-) Transcript_31561:95-718(-)
MIGPWAELLPRCTWRLRLLKPETQLFLMDSLWTTQLEARCKRTPGAMVAARMNGSSFTVRSAWHISSTLLEIPIAASYGTTKSGRGWAPCLRASMFSHRFFTVIYGAATLALQMVNPLCSIQLCIGDTTKQNGACPGAHRLVQAFGKAIESSFQKMMDFMTESLCILPIIIATITIFLVVAISVLPVKSWRRLQGILTKEVLEVEDI